MLTHILVLLLTVRSAVLPPVIPPTIEYDKIRPFEESYDPDWLLKLAQPQLRVIGGMYHVRHF